MRHNERKANFGGILLNDPRIRPHDIYIKVSNGIWPSSKIFCTAIRYGSHLLVETKWAVPELPSGIRYEVDGERLYPNLRLGYPVRHRYGFLCPHADWDHTWPSAQYEIGSRLFGDEKLLERAASYRSRPILQCKYCPTDIGQGLEEFPGYKSCWTVTTWRIISSHIDNPRLDQAFSAQQQTASGFSHVVKLNNLSNYVLGGAIKQLWEKLNSRVDSEEQTPYVLPHLHEILGGHIERFANRLPDSYSRDIEYDRQRNLGIHTKTWGRGSYEARMKNFRAAGLLDEGDNCYNHAYATNVLPESDKSGLCLSTSG
ncbi:hypothetical protein MMC25_005688 [Agyrium rufum]|nr:hypothetical protein [Agyrium rufum]